MLFRASKKRRAHLCTTLILALGLYRGACLSAEPRKDLEVVKMVPASPFGSIPG